MPHDDAAASEGRRASDRGRYGKLSRERVLAAAVALVDREGLSALSMRRLGAELDVEAMALYRYADNKDALLDGLVEALYIELEESLAAGRDEDAGPGSVKAAGSGPGKAGGSGSGSGKAAGAGRKRGARVPEWRAGLHRIARETRRTALRHPQVVPLLATRILAVPLARRPLPVLRHQEQVLELLSQAELTEEAAAAAHRAYTAWLLGSLFVELQALDDEPDEPDPSFRLGLHRMPARELPLLRAAAPALAGEHDGPGELTAGLDALLDRLIAA